MNPGGFFFDVLQNILFYSYRPIVMKTPDDGGSKSHSKNSPRKEKEGKKDDEILRQQTGQIQYIDGDKES